MRTLTGWAMLLWRLRALYGCKSFWLSGHVQSSNVKQRRTL